jgi:uncharacterized membrane protein
MNLVSANIPVAWLWGLWSLAAFLGILIARRAGWNMLRDGANLNVFLAATVAVLGLWLIKTGIKPGLNFHLLGATALTLMFRPLFALLAIALTTAAITLWQGEYAAFAANWLIMGAIRWACHGRYSASSTENCPTTCSSTFFSTASSAAPWPSWP